MNIGEQAPWTRLRGVFGKSLHIVLTAALALPALAHGQTYDVLIRGGEVYDGSDRPARKADVAIQGDRIVRVGTIPSTAKAKLIVNARGRIVAPGFIDPHSHAAEGLQTPQLAPAKPLLLQGITTVFTNADGFGPSDLTQQLAKTRALVPGVNVAPMIGHNGVRTAVMGKADRQPTPADLESMKSLVRKAMDHGAFGLSTGLTYAPGRFSQTSEIVELAKVAAGYPGGFYSSHMRDEGVGILESIDELIAIARQARITAVATHFKAAGKVVWGKSGEMIDRIERARAEGLSVWADQYPYEAIGGNIRDMLIPRWAQDGGQAAVAKRLKDPALRAKIAAAVAENIENFGGAHLFQIRNYPADRSLNGKRLHDIAAAQRMTPVEMAMKMVENGNATTVIFCIDPVDLEAIMKKPWTMTGSDGNLVTFGVSAEHPRAYGNFPRKIRRYVLDRPVISMKQAIHAATGLTASVLQLRDRGYVREGYYADVIVFDPKTIRDTATYERPHSYSVGIDYVFVNGSAAVAKGEVVSSRFGRVLSRNN